MEQALITYVTACGMNDEQLPHIAEMITVAIEEHDKPPKPVKEKKAKAADDTVAAEPIVEEEQPANAVVDENEPEEKPKKVIKRKAHKK